MNKRLPLIIFTAVIFPAIIIVLLRNTAPAGIERSTYTVLNTYPHDREAFTQGLFFKDGYFYESTGLWGRSSLRKVAMETGRVEKIHELDVLNGIAYDEAEDRLFVTGKLWPLIFEIEIVVRE